MKKIRQKNARIVMYPAFENAEELAAQYHRLRWYVPEGSGFQITMFYKGHSIPSTVQLEALRPEYLDASQGGAANIKIVPWSLGRFAASAAQSATVGLWKVGSAKLPDKLSVLSGRRFVVLDPHAKGTWEFARYATLLYDHGGRAAKAQMRKESRKRLRRVASELTGLQKGYVFGTGPSLARATDFGYADGVRIVCNSIVRNPELLEHIRPHFIAASDFVFHFGPSGYAAEFRRDLLAAMKTTGAYLLIPEQIAPLMLAHYPEIADRLIAVPLTNRYDFREKKKPVNVELLGNFQVRTLDSVLNLLMLPVASTLADQVYIIGCDGRKPSDNAFWSHHNASQYAGLMKTVNETHPGFFDVDYVDYYDRYCKHVAAVISAGEALGKRYASLVPSHVPALAERLAADQAAS